MTRCIVCREPMTVYEPGQLAHPTCPGFVYDEPDGPSLFEQQLKQQLTDIILWADRNAPRSQQQAIGPSEIGTLCDRRIAYRLANIAEVNRTTDPWAAIVGTAIHAWLDKAIASYQRSAGTDNWIVESRVVVDHFIQGRSDLYDRATHTVIDHKSASADKMRQIRNSNEVPIDYYVQIQTYGLGFEQLGYPVKRVAIAFYPRSGRLKDMIVRAFDYDRSVAEKALQRVYDIAAQLVQLDIFQNSHRWQQIEAESSDACGLCPWYVAGRDPERGADETGCPGR